MRGLVGQQGRGEEGYNHKKYQKDGRKIWCLPFLRWVHRFDRPRGVQYPLIIEERIRNYLVGHRELELPYDEIIEHFNETQPHVNIQNLIDNLDNQDYLKGYDKLTNGFNTNVFLGYKYEKAKNKFQIGIESSIGFTKNRRSYNFVSMGPDDELKLDLMNGIKFIWWIPVSKRTTNKNYYY